MTKNADHQAKKQRSMGLRLRVLGLTVSCLLQDLSVSVALVLKPPLAWPRLLRGWLVLPTRGSNGGHGSKKANATAALSCTAVEVVAHGFG